MPEESTSIQAIQLTKRVFESINSNLGLLKFNVEELIPTNGSDGHESMKWDVICSFYETLGSTTPTRYKASVDLNNKTVAIKKIVSDTETPMATYRFVKAEEGEKKEGEKKI